MTTESIGHLAAIFVSSLVGCGYLVILLVGIFPFFAAGAWMAASLFAVIQGDAGKDQDNMIHRPLTSWSPGRRQRSQRRETLESAC